MAQYIDKDALLAEIDKLKDEALEYEDKSRWFLVAAIKKRIKSLEVKEVNLEKELDSMITSELKLHKALPSLFDVAKHFFQLGLSVSNPLTVKDIENIYHLVNKVSDDLGIRAMYINIYKETLKRFKAQKGEEV